MAIVPFDPEKLDFRLNAASGNFELLYDNFIEGRAAVDDIFDKDQLYFRITLSGGGVVNARRVPVKWTFELLYEQQVIHTDIFYMRGRSAFGSGGASEIFDVSQSISFPDSDRHQITQTPFYATAEGLRVHTGNDNAHHTPPDTSDFAADNHSHAYSDITGTHANEDHNPDFATISDITSRISTHAGQANVHHTPPTVSTASHGNELHNPDFATDERLNDTIRHYNGHIANANAHHTPPSTRDFATRTHSHAYPDITGTHGNEDHNPNFATNTALDDHTDNEDAHHNKAHAHDVTVDVSLDDRDLTVEVGIETDIRTGNQSAEDTVELPSSSTSVHGNESHDPDFLSEIPVHDNAKHNPDFAQDNHNHPYGDITGTHNNSDHNPDFAEDDHDHTRSDVTDFEHNNNEHSVDFLSGNHGNANHDPDFATISDITSRITTHTNIASAHHTRPDLNAYVLTSTFNTHTGNANAHHTPPTIPSLSGYVTTRTFNTHVTAFNNHTGNASAHHVKTPAVTNTDTIREYAYRVDNGNLQFRSRIRNVVAGTNGNWTNWTTITAVSSVRADTDTTYDLTINDRTITLTGSDGTEDDVDLPEDTGTLYTLNKNAIGVVELLTNPAMEVHGAVKINHDDLGPVKPDDHHKH